MKMSDSEVKGKLGTLSNWQLARGKLHKEFKFESFAEAIKFVNDIAQIAGSLNHHPDIINTYNKVTLEINTHDEGGITPLDFEFAKQVDLLQG